VDTAVSEFLELELPYEDNSISVEFAALSFTDPVSNRYAYKLEPLEKEWILLDNKHDVNLINLKPDKYLFSVKGSNGDGFWNEKGKSITIIINRPLLQNWWFWVLAVFIITSGFFYFFRWRINIKEEANAQLKKEIVERKRAEKLYRTLVDTSPDAITLSVVDTEAIIRANRQAANLLGYSSEEEFKREVKNIFDIFSPNDRERARKNAEEIIRAGTNRNNEYTLTAKDGTPISVEISTALIKDDTGNPKYFLSTARDTRNRKEAERQEKLQREILIQADKMVSLGKLLSGVAHELNNPIASIKMNAESFSKVWTDVAPVLDKHYESNKNFKMANMPYELSK